MTFTLDGERYRIVFQHDPPRNWGAHATHSVTLSGGEELFCETCQASLSDLGPLAIRKLRGMDAIETNRLVARELARNVECIIQRYMTSMFEVAGEWSNLYIGHSRLNIDAGDPYNRERGRLAALRNALPVRDAAPPTAEMLEREQCRRRFCKAAMEAYLERKCQGKRAGGAA